MSIANPYQPPRADVADVGATSGTYQPIKLWSSKGRVGRLQYLGYLMGGYLALIAGSMAFAVIAGLAGAHNMAPFAALILSIPYFVFSIIMLIQRTHDMGWSGWTALLIIIPLAALVWIFKAGTPGDNQFGAPPPPNTTKVKILALVMPVLFTVIIGVLAAVALPAYQGYVARAKAMQAPVEQPVSP